MSDVAGDPLLATASGAFVDRFGKAPTHVSRAPGRVNLIGEHIDYNGLPVLPMALQRRCTLVLRPREDGRIVLHDVDPRFPPVEFEIGPTIEPYVTGSWGNYAKAPAAELARRFAIWRGFDGLIGSDVPTAAGLSSSSALVNAVGLALAHINQVPTEPWALAEVMAAAERYVGTRGGGMDQAISLGARDRCAARISFDPLRARHVNVPDDWCIVVADSGTRAEKSGATRLAYNRRRQECDEALREVSGEAVRAGVTETLCTTWPRLLAAVDSVTLVDLAEDVVSGTLLRRFRHVVGEAARVETAVDRLLAADLSGFGTLMDASHASLRGDFGVSTADLDELVAVAREGGAAGARLTGAGFGGCIVALADRWTVGGVLETLVAEYFERRGLTERLDDRLFIAVPSAGASYGEIPSRLTRHGETQS